MRAMNIKLDAISPLVFRALNAMITLIPGVRPSMYQTDIPTQHTNRLPHTHPPQYSLIKEIGENYETG